MKIKCRKIRSFLHLLTKVRIVIYNSLENLNLNIQKVKLEKKVFIRIFHHELVKRQVSVNKFHLQVVLCLFYKT